MIADYYNVTVDATEDPVTLAEARDWLRMRTTADDTIIGALVAAATQLGEKYTNRVFVERTIEGFFDGVVPANCGETVPFVQVRRSPLIAVSAVEIMSGGSYVAFTDYNVKQLHGFSRILFNNGIYDATPDTDATYPLKVTFTAGYGAASAVPAAIKSALKAHISFLYENRGDVHAEGKIGMPLEAKAIYSGKYRILNTFG